MKHERLLKQISKVSIVEMREEVHNTFFNNTRETYTNYRFIAKSKTHVCSWWRKEGNVQSLSLHRLNDQDDIQSDYHCGWFPKTIKSAVLAMQDK